MKQRSRIQCILILFALSIACLQGQQAVVTTGGTATGAGGSATYTVGQVAYQTYTGSSGSVAQGVQQPWEISTVTAIENTEGISLAISVYPNPTSGSLKLTIKDFDYKDLRYRIYDMTGLLLQDKEIVSEETEIIMNDFTSAMYFLKIANSKQEVKVFKIIKK
ncbi:MAG TPA: T9SS type A sorting domain-containing protein [Bacteroidales bacterium]|nr:T9SS type A sorting domain-containing protein [Bacteroidales bacterium]